MRLTAVVLRRVRALAAQRFGLAFPPERDPDLEHALTKAVGLSRRRSAEHYLDGLAGRPDDDPELGRLSGLLTVGETYFWRDPSCIEELERHVLPALVRARRAQRALRLRVWSAGCATGEEPYTLAILLDGLLPDRDDWEIDLIATDLNPGALAIARRGCYGPWSLRHLPPEVRDRWFEPRGPKLFQLDPRIRKWVRFERASLLHGLPAVECAPVDLILCRNVLMYLTPEAAREAVGRLRAALAKDGTLLVAPAEASAELFRPLRAVRFSGGIAFRRSGTPEPVARAAARARSIDTVGVQGRPAAPRPEVAAPAPEADLKTDARRLADRGHLDEALRLCRRALDADRLDAEAYRLLAEIQQERGDTGAALEALRRALFLEPDAPDARLALGNLRRKHAAAR